MTRASTSDEDIETLLTCGDKLRRYCADIQAKSSVQTQELIEWLERAEQILRATEQGTKGVQKAVSNTFAKQIVSSRAARPAKGFAVSSLSLSLSPCVADSVARPFLLSRRRCPRRPRRPRGLSLQVQVLTTRNARSGRRRGSKRQRGSETIDGDAADGSDASASPSLALQVSARCACCFVLLLRLFAPACPFSDEEMEKVFTRGLFSEDGTSALVTRLCLRPPPLSPQPQPQEANQGGAKGKKTRGGRGKRKEEDRGAAEAAAANAEVYQRGLFVLETLREVKACLLVLDLESEDSLCALLATLFRCVNARNVSDLREVVTGLAGEVMEEGAADLGPGPWEAFLMECVGPNGAAQLTHLEKRARAITKRKIGAAAAPLDPWDWEPRADTPGAGGSDEEGPAEALSGDSSEGQGEDDESQTSGELAAMDGAADGALGDTSASAIVARAVLRQKALVLGPHVQKFLAGVLGDRPAGALVHDDRAYQALIYALYLTCPKIMIPVLPRLSASLFVDVQSKRVNAVDLLGHFLVSVRGLDFARDYCGSLFKDFLSRFLDKSAVVRMRMITIAECVIVRHMRENNNAGLGPLEGEPPAPAETETGTEDTEDAQGVALRSEPCVMALLEGLTDKVVDPDERVRLAAVSAVGHIFTLSPSCLGQAQYEHFRGRLRDTRVSVRAECALHLARAFGAHIRRVHNDGGSWQDEERVQEIPTSLLKAYNTDKCLRERPRARHHGDHGGDGGGAGGGGRTSLAVPVLERALGRGLWPDCLLAAEVVRHWVVVFSNQDKGDQDALFKCLQLKLAFRNSIRQVLRLREEEKNPFMADQGQEDPEARGRKKASIAKLCQRIAAGWLSDPAKSASGLQRIADLEDDKVLSTLLSLTESRDGEERLELRSALLASVQYSREVQSAMAQVCNYLVHAPIGGNHVMALLGILGQGQGSQGSQEEEEEAHREFLPHCRRFALRLARADPSLFTQPEATRGLLEMLLEDDEDTCLASLEILELTHTKQRFRARDRGTGKEGEDMAAPVIASDSAEETKLVRLVSDHRSDVSTRAISLAPALLSSDRAHSVLREEAKRSLRILAKHGDQNQMSLTNVSPAALAFGVIGNIAHVAPKVLQASLLDVVNAVCFVLTNPLPDLDPSKAPPKGRRRSREGGEAAMAPHRLFTAAADCLWRVLCPRSSDSGSPALPEEVRRAVPNAVQYLANMVDLENPLMEGERRHECPSAHKAEVRLAAAIAILRIARRHDLAFSVYREVCLVVQDPSRETRSKVAAEMNALIASFQSSRPPEVTKAAKFAAALALAGADPNQENREVAGG